MSELAMGGGGLDGYFGEQRLPVGIQECPERFHRCVDYLSWQFVPEWDSPNGEGELATARTASLLVELECVAAWPLAGLKDEGGRNGEFQETMGNLERTSVLLFPIALTYSKANALRVRKMGAFSSFLGNYIGVSFYVRLLHWTHLLGLRFRPFCPVQKRT